MEPNPNYNPAGYDNTDSGALFRNDRKTKLNQPDHKGSINVCCPKCGESSDFWLSAWIKTAGPNSKNPGSKFFSLAVNPKEPPSSYPSGENMGGVVDEDIPF